MKQFAKRLSIVCYRIIRWFVWLFYPKTAVEGLHNLPDTPCIIVSNHAQMNGPIACELYFPGHRAIWCAGQMMHLKDVPAYAYQDFWSAKPKYIRWFYKLLSYLIAPISVCVFNNAHTIAVHRDTRLIHTFRQTVTALSEGANVVIFPECATPYNNIVNTFQDRFIDVAKLYYKRTGKAISFIPMYIAPKLHTMYLGSPIWFNPDTPIEEERLKLCQYLMAQISQIAADLPNHTVVPYSNVSKKSYPTNIPIRKETIHEETGC